MPIWSAPSISNPSPWGSRFYRPKQTSKNSPTSPGTPAPTKTLTVGTLTLGKLECKRWAIFTRVSTLVIVAKQTPILASLGYTCKNTWSQSKTAKRVSSCRCCSRALLCRLMRVLILRNQPPASRLHSLSFSTYFVHKLQYFCHLWPYISQPAKKKWRLNKKNSMITYHINPFIIQSAIRSNFNLLDLFAQGDVLASIESDKADYEHTQNSERAKCTQSNILSFI